MEPGSDGLAADKARRQVLVTSLEQTEMDYDGDLIDARRFKAKSDRITGEIAEIDERLTSGIQRSLSSKVLRAPAPGAAFTNAPVDIQRAVLRSVLTVTVRPTTARGMKWSSGRLRRLVRAGSSPAAGRLRIAPVHQTAGRDTLGTVVK